MPLASHIERGVLDLNRTRIAGYGTVVVGHWGGIRNGGLQCLLLHDGTVERVSCSGIDDDSLRAVVSH